MIDFQWNKCEQEQAKKLAKKIGCDDFQIIRDIHEPRKKSVNSNNERTSNCLWPYILLLINAYGDVIPCFKPDFNPGTLGNIDISGFNTVWNGNEIKKIRSRVLIKSREGCCLCNE